jgi:hypothetical protein
MKLSPATGLFTGSFLDAGSMKRAFSGAILQGQSLGYGFFQEPTGATGGVFLQKTPP